MGALCDEKARAQVQEMAVDCTPRMIAMRDLARQIELSATGTMISGVLADLVFTGAKISLASRLILAVLLHTFAGTKVTAPRLKANTIKYKAKIEQLLTENKQRILKMGTGTGEDYAELTAGSSYTIRGTETDKKTDVVMSVEAADGGQLLIAHDWVGGKPDQGRPEQGKPEQTLYKNVPLPTARAKACLALFYINTDGLKDESEVGNNLLHLLCVLMEPPPTEP
jgi:hypothetical protein